MRGAIDHLAVLPPFFDKSRALTEDAPGDIYVFGDVTIAHSDGWHVAVARFEDDQWWLDFTQYGEDLTAVETDT